MSGTGIQRLRCPFPHHWVSVLRHQLGRGAVRNTSHASQLSGLCQDTFTCVTMQLNPRPNQDGGFDLAMGKSTLEDFGIKVYQGEPDVLPPTA